MSDWATFRPVHPHSDRKDVAVPGPPRGKHRERGAEAAQLGGSGGGDESIGELSLAAHEEEGVGVVAAGPLHLCPGGVGGGGKR